MPPLSSPCRSCDTIFSEVRQSCSPQQRRLLSRATTRRRFRRGQILYDEGEPCESVYCIHSGRLKLYKFGLQEQEVILGLAGPRDLVGYLACLDGGPHETSCETLGDVEACSVSAQVLRQVLANAGSSTRPLLRRMARDLRGAQNEIVSRTHMSAESRIARLLMWFLNGDPIPEGGVVLSLPMKRWELAQMAGTTPETFSRVLHVMHENGIVRLKGRKILVRKPRQLGALARVKPIERT